VKISRDNFSAMIRIHGENSGCEWITTPASTVNP